MSWQGVTVDSITGCSSILVLLDRALNTWIAKFTPKQSDQNNINISYISECYAIRQTESTSVHKFANSDA